MLPFSAEVPTNHRHHRSAAQSWNVTARPHGHGTALSDGLYQCVAPQSHEYGYAPIDHGEGAGGVEPPWPDLQSGS